MVRTLLIRADASTRIGNGHVMRCLSLAQAWHSDGGEVVFICAELPEALERRLKAENCTVVRIVCEPGSGDDAKEILRVARQYRADLGNNSNFRSRTCGLRPATSNTWLVADGYHFGAEYQRAIKDAGLRLLLLDDYGHATHYYADFILNQNLSADEELYKNREPATKLLLGTNYVLLRHQFLAYRNRKREIPAIARKVLVTLGGSDPDNVTAKVIEALRGLDVEAKIVVGSSNQNLEELRLQISGLSSHPSSLKLLTDVSNMPELMAWADVAIAAGGSTSWELAFMGLPSLVLVLADNQIEIVESLRREGISVVTGPLSATDSNVIVKLLGDRQQRVSMNQRGRQLVDGHGSERVVELLYEHARCPVYQEKIQS